MRNSPRVLEEVSSVELRRVWRQKVTPVVFKRGKGMPLMVKLPYDLSNREWLRQDKRSRPDWNAQYTCWETPRSWFDDIITRTLKKFGKVYVIQPLRTEQKCAPACWDAKGYDCECSCMGENHGSGHPGGDWHEVSETFAVNWGRRAYACRLIEAKKLPNRLGANRSFSPSL